jgi:flagellar hook assembly protein FlgD
VPSSLLVRVVFGALVIATLGAFVVTQRLKRSTPIVERVYYRSSFSPTSRHPRVNVRFKLPKRETGVTVSIVNADGDDVRTLAEGRTLGRGFHTYRWNGRADNGVLVPDGPYRLRVTLRGQGRALTATRTVTVDTRPPVVHLTSVMPQAFLPGSATNGTLRVRFSGPSLIPRPQIGIWRTDLPKPQEVVTFPVHLRRHSASWDGRLADGSFAPDGVYEVSVTAFDQAANAGSAPSRLPPVRGATAPGSGFSIRYLTLGGPLEPVSAGSVVRFKVGPVPRRLRWSLSSAGAEAPLTRGAGSASTTLAVRVPPRAPTGLYILRVQAGGHRAQAPLAVRGHSRGRVLVVLPAIAWQGLNPVDDDNDGFPNLLTSRDTVGIDRPFAHGLPPAGLVQQVVPLLRFLDRSGLPYDLTTDLALARGNGPGLTGRPGVLFPGDETWLTDRVQLDLQNYVQGGGRVASFGTDSFRRLVSLGADQLGDPSTPERVSLFSEETAEASSEAAPMQVGSDTLALFAGTGGFFGSFTRLEQQQRLVGGAQILSQAGRDPQHPAFVAYSLGKGIVVRVGSPDWASQLTTSVEMGTVTRRIWSLLSQ